jgi:NADP-dependent 3-hydroxy acid dehydrogenase YdfG
MAASGAHVTATARNLERAPELQLLLQAHGSALKVVTLDVVDAASIKVQNVRACAFATCPVSSALAVAAALAVCSGFRICL